MKRYTLVQITVRFVTPRGETTEQPAGNDGYLFFEEDVVRRGDDHPLAPHIGAGEIGFKLIEGYGRFSDGLMIAREKEVST